MIDESELKTDGDFDFRIGLAVDYNHRKRKSKEIR
jgi:hypothetical protein